jgi:hypothetical protein
MASTDVVPQCGQVIAERRCKASLQHVTAQFRDPLALQQNK